jgi:hypothetical protein
MNQTLQKNVTQKKKILILQYKGVRLEKEVYRKGILHLISIQNFLSLLHMLILELSGRKWIQRMESSGKGPWLNKWNPLIRMRLEIFWSFRLEEISLVENGYLKIS